MKKSVFILLLCVIGSWCFSQITPPPSRLKYFGFAIVDCGLDDPNDSPTVTNFTTEVDTFSNVAEMCAASHIDTIVNRVNLMNAHCMKPILSISSVFIYLKDNTGPSGSNYDLYPNYQTRWDSFKVLNASVLNAQQVAMFYACDEPTWNGVNFSELSTICNTVKADFPSIPLCFVEAYTMVNQVQVPTNVDIIGFDHYGIYDVSTDTNYLAWLDTLESKRSTPTQKIVLVFDEEWNWTYWPNGWTADSMETVLDNYYKLALADTNVCAMVGFTWPGIAVGWLGARSLPQHVINKSIAYGKLIKNNYNPCTVGIDDKSLIASAEIFPNPAHDDLTLIVRGTSRQMRLRVYDCFGKLISEELFEERLKIPARDFSAGIYFFNVADTKGNLISSGKFVRE